jgi:hypothetical protein
MPLGYVSARTIAARSTTTTTTTITTGIGMLFLNHLHRLLMLVHLLTIVSTTGAQPHQLHREQRFRIGYSSGLLQGLRLLRNHKQWDSF